MDLDKLDNAIQSGERELLRTPKADGPILVTRAHFELLMSAARSFYVIAQSSREIATAAKDSA
jgi:hypothetical protein